MSTILSLHDPEIARRFYADGTWRDDTLYGLLAQHAQARPDAFALRDGSRRLRWISLRDWVDAVADEFHAAGVRRGQRVGVWLPNRVEAVVTFLACSRNGYVCCPSLHRNHTTAQIAQLMRRISCAALVVQPGYGADADRHDIVDAMAGGDGPRRIYAVEGARGAARPFPLRDAAPRVLTPTTIPTRSSISPSPRAPPASPRA
jgi:acyl-CoA synthetase